MKLRKPNRAKRPGYPNIRQPWGHFRPGRFTWKRPVRRYDGEKQELREQQEK